MCVKYLAKAIHLAMGNGLLWNILCGRSSCNNLCESNTWQGISISPRVTACCGASFVVDHQVIVYVNRILGKGYPSRQG